MRKCYHLGPFMLLVAFLAACSPKHYPQVIIKDSVRVEIRERLIHDTVTFEVPKIVEKVVTKDTCSFLENDWAQSCADYSDGFLYHTLETKPHTVYVPYTVEVHDTTYIEKTGQETVIEKEVEKPLSWCQRFRLGAFWWLVLISTGLAVWTFRKPLLSFIGKFV